MCTRGTHEKGRMPRPTRRRDVLSRPVRSPRIQTQMDMVSLSGFVCAHVFVPEGVCGFICVWYVCVRECVLGFILVCVCVCVSVCVCVEREIICLCMYVCMYV